MSIPLLNTLWQFLASCLLPNLMSLAKGVFIGLVATATWYVIELIISLLQDNYIKETVLKGLNTEVRGRSLYSESVSRLIIKNDTNRIINFERVLVLGRRSHCSPYNCSYQLTGAVYNDYADDCDKYKRTYKKSVYPGFESDWRFPDGVVPDKDFIAERLKLTIHYEDHHGRTRFLTMTPECPKLNEDVAKLFTWPSQIAHPSDKMKPWIIPTPFIPSTSSPQPPASESAPAPSPPASANRP